MDPKLIIAIAGFVLLVAVFFVLFVLNHRTPVPKGCENIKISEENCGGCMNADCDIRQKFDKKKIEDELKDEEEKK